MRDARSPWSWSGNSYWGHMAWKTAAAGKLHLILRPWEWIFTFCWFSWARGRCCADLFCVFLSVYKRGPFIFLWKKKKKVFRPNMCDLCFHELESVWIWVLIRQTVKRVVKLHVFVLTELFFFVSVSCIIHFDLSCCVELSISIFVWHPLCSRYSSTWRSCSLRSASFTLPPTHFSWFPTGPSLLPLSSSSSSPIYLFFSSPSLSLSSVSHILLDSALGLMLMTHHPTWKHFLCGCEGAFTAVNENFKQRRPRPAPPEKKKCGWWGGKKQEISFFSSHPNIATFDEGFINF